MWLKRAATAATSVAIAATLAACGDNRDGPAIASTTTSTTSSTTTTTEVRTTTTWIVPTTTRPPLVVRLTSPADIAAALDVAAVRVIGRRATDVEKRAFAAYFQAREREQQTLAYNGETHFVPTLASEAERWIRSRNPREAHEMDVIRTMDDFYDVITEDDGAGRCHDSYPDFCIPPPPPDLDCEDMSRENFRVRGPDPHGFDRDGDGYGCEPFDDVE